MIRRNARLRREYLYRKSLEGKERAEYERKRKIREALDGANNWVAAFTLTALPRSRSTLWLLLSCLLFGYYFLAGCSRGGFAG